MTQALDATRRLASRRPAALLGAACAIQLAIGAAIALSSTHNGFVWYSGGDATEYWTDGWVLAHHAVPQAVVGPGMPLLYSWLSWLTGPSLVSALPVITMLQLVVLVPLAALLVWAIADLLFGRTFAWWTLALWLVAPVLLLAGFDATYAPQFRDLFLAPHWYGLTDMADLPSLVAVLATAWAMLRMAERRTVEDAVLGGTFMGALILIKPANGFFVPAALILLAATREIRTIAVWCAAVVPELAALTVWKAKGLGHVPLLAARYAREAMGRVTVVAVTNRYVHLDWSHFTGELRDLGGVFWSVRVLEFLAVAGLLGALRRSAWKGAFLGVWFIAFVIVKGSTDLASVPSVSYYRYVEPGLPAFALLTASIAYFVPRRARAFAPATTPAALPGGLRTAGIAAVLLGLVPLAVLAATPAASTPRDVLDLARINDAPIASRLTATTQVTNGTVRLSWRPYRTRAASVYYVVYRSSRPATCSVPPSGGAECDLDMTSIGYTSATSFVDHASAGRHWYRVGLMANYTKTLDGSDLMLIGPATAATNGR